MKEKDHKWMWSVVETDNYGGDYPDESFVIRRVRREAAEEIADLINKELCVGMASRFWKVVEDGLIKPYKLQPGFEP